MAAQLRLFPLMKPLVERFGQEFFRAAPRTPGVYMMRCSGEQILYIGQSKNLRLRLAFYKNANPDRIPRRLIRLVHQVEDITWECLPSAEAARARELELLRLHRPRFNRADTGPQFFHFLDYHIAEGYIQIRVLLEEPPQPVGQLRGPIRGKLIPLQALASLQRLSEAVARQHACCAELPYLPKRLAAVTVHNSSAIVSFLHGDSTELVTSLLEQISPRCELALRQLLEMDAEVLLSWFRALSEADRVFSV